MDDVIFNKAAIIERSVRRVREEYAGDRRNLIDHLTKQDSIILNLQRACEAAIDLAMHLVRRLRLGIPQESRDAFALLATAGIITESMADSLKRMVGFRNIAVHDYQKLNLEIVESIVTERMAELTAFGEWALKSGPEILREATPQKLFPVKEQ